jgi:hypothetical protein
MAAPPPRMSPWAIASLVCSLAICPPLCLLGPLLGAVALMQMRLRPRQYTGLRLARAGIAIGVAAMVAWGGAGLWWHVHIRRLVLDGPEIALRAGLDGDLATFRASVRGPGAIATDEEAEAFIIREGSWMPTVDKWGWIVIADPQRVDLAYPAAAPVDRADDGGEGPRAESHGR